MKYEDLYLTFKAMFKGDEEIFKALEEKNGLEPNDPEMIHVYFCPVVSPYVYNLLRKDDKEKLKKAFAFFEDMANDSDVEVQGVLQFSVLENITTESKDIYKAAQKYIGPETKTFVNQVATYMNIEPMK